MLFESNDDTLKPRIAAFARLFAGRPVLDTMVRHGQLGSNHGWCHLVFSGSHRLLPAVRCGGTATD